MSIDDIIKKFDELLPLKLGDWRGALTAAEKAIAAGTYDADLAESLYMLVLGGGNAEDTARYLSEIETMLAKTSQK